MDLWDELNPITDDELMDDPFDGEIADDYPEDYWFEEVGFDPYLGYYTDDC